VKGSLTIPVVLALAVSPRVARGQDAPPIARYVPNAPDRRHVFVTDSAHILSAETIAALQDSAQALQSATGADIAWVTLPTLGGRAIEEATVYLGRTWKVGSAGQPGDALRNRGLVILYVPDKSKTAGSNFRVEVGKGLQGTIIDSRSRAISAAMREDLRAKRYDAGYLAGWNAAAALVREDRASGATERVGGAPSSRSSVTGRPAHRFMIGPAIVVGVFALLVVGGIFLVIILRRRTARVGMPSPAWMVLAALSDADDDDSRRRRDSGSSWLGSDSGGDSGSSSDSGGGDFGGGGGFDGGGSSDSI
jgi:uncharacterized protein